MMAGDVTRTTSRLADGRELLYFDDEPGADRSQPDRRAIAAARTASEIRYDVLVDQWVVIAGHRQTRTHLPPTTQCPLCPSTSDRLTEVPAGDYDVVVFENRFPSLSHGLEPGPGGLLQDPTGDGLFVRRPGLGRCEVVCFTADHDASFAHLSPRRVATVLEAWTDRTRELSALPGVEQVFVFENRGEEIGVTLAHPHGQIYAYPFVPPRMMRMVSTAERHRATRGTCLFCEVLAAEEASDVRVVAKRSRWVAFVPHAARWPFEVHLPTTGLCCRSPSTGGSPSLRPGAPTTFCAWSRSRGENSTCGSPTSGRQRCAAGQRMPPGRCGRWPRKASRWADSSR
jgi:UDPglucose--hexose-1-phosphate uridylyltransferase